MITLPDTATLAPQVLPAACGTLHLLPSTATELLRIDLIHESGSAYQPQPLCAAAANRLFTVAAGDMDTHQVAEFLDFRGIVVEHTPDVLTCTTTFYLLRRYLDQLMPLLTSLLRQPSFPQNDLDIFCRKRKQEIETARMNSTDEARRLFYQALFGTQHPLGRYAQPDDADRLTREVVKRFYEERYGTMDMVVSGNMDEAVTENLLQLAASVEQAAGSRQPLSATSSLLPDTHYPLPTTHSRLSAPLDGAVQASLRVGRVVPLAWDSPDYARFLLLTTLLGGYFGSRLMNNLREEKGYTYGIYARTQIYRGVIVFCITADVAGGTAVMAGEEIRRELRRLCDEPVGAEELALVKTVMAGDFIRSVDGIFERAERLCSMLATRVTEVFTDNLRQALAETTPAQLQQLAQRLLNPDDMVYCSAGAVD